MQQKVIKGLALMLLSSCNPANKIDHDTAIKSEAQKSLGETPTLEEGKSEISQEAGAEDLVAEAEAPGNSGKTEENTDIDVNNQTALEPVPIGGAFLTCRYQGGHSQGSESYRMDCEVAPVTEVKATIVSAAFYKIDASGKRSPLSILSQDLLALKWTVQEDLTTISQTQVQVVLSVPGLLSATLTTTVSPTFSLQPNPNYWLGGEPNSLNAEEDCVEFVPASGKISHQNFTGLTTGPLGRMNDIVCTTSYNFLCRKQNPEETGAKWVVSAAAGPHSDGTTACRPGYSFGFPLNAAEVREVIDLVDRFDIKVWVNMNDRDIENTFLSGSADNRESFT